VELLEEGGDHPRKESFQIGAATSELDPAKVGKYKAWHVRRTQRASLSISIGKGRLERDPEYLQSGHEGETLEQIVGVEVSGRGDVLQRECNQARGSRKQRRIYGEKNIEEYKAP